MGEQSFIKRGINKMDISSMTMEEIWAEIDQQLIAAPEHIAGVEATYTLDITGDEAAKYGLILKDGESEVVEEGIEDADCLIILNVKNFKKLLQGDLNTTTAFMTGRLKVKGNIGLALKLENILKQYSF